MQVVVVRDQRGNRGEQSRRRGDQRFGDAGATARKLAAPTSPRPENASITPQTVPNSPMKGDTEAMVANVDIPFSRRRTSSPAHLHLDAYRVGISDLVRAAHA